MYDESKMVSSTGRKAREIDYYEKQVFRHFRWFNCYDLMPFNWTFFKIDPFRKFAWIIGPTALRITIDSIYLGNVVSHGCFRCELAWKADDEFS